MHVATYILYDVARKIDSFNIPRKVDAVLRKKSLLQVGPCKTAFKFASVATWKCISKYDYDIVSNVSHFPAVNQRVERWIEKHQGQEIQINHIYMGIWFRA